MKAPGPVDPPDDNHSTPRKLHGAWDRVQNITSSNSIPRPPRTWGAAFLFGCFCIMATPDQASADMSYTQTFTNNVAGARPATDLFVNYYLSATSPAITYSSATATNGTGVTFGGYRVQYTVNGKVYASAFELNLAPALPVNGSVTVNFTSDVALKNAMYSWSYNNGTNSPLQTAAPTLVPEPTTIPMALIATGVGLVIKWNSYRRTHRRQ